VLPQPIRDVVLSMYKLLKYSRYFEYEPILRCSWTYNFVPINSRVYRLCYSFRNTLLQLAKMINFVQ